MAQPNSEPEQLVQEYAEVWNEQDYSRLSDVVSESFVHKAPSAPGGEVRGPEEVEAFIREMTSAFPDFEGKIIDSFASGNRAVAELQFNMTHEGAFKGIPPTGREVEIQTLAIVDTADGKLREMREYANMQEIPEQLGLTFPAILGQLPKLAIRKLRMTV